jgi:hypothetical protein
MALALAGCGGGSSGSTTAASTTPSDAATAYQSAFSGMVATHDALTDLSNSAFTAIPKTGTARFKGYVNFTSTASDYKTVMSLLGDAQLTADFSKASISGTATNFVKVTQQTAPHRAILAADRAAGTLSITQGQIGVGVANDVQMEISGTLKTPKETIEVLNTLGGKFVGSPIRGLAANSAAYTTIVTGRNEQDITINGTSQFVEAELYATKQ